MIKGSRRLTKRLLAPAGALLATMAFFAPNASAAIEAQTQINTVVSAHGWVNTDYVGGLNGYSVEGQSGGTVCLELFHIWGETTVPKKCGAGYVGAYNNNEPWWGNPTMATIWNESSSPQRLIGTKWVKHDTLASGYNQPATTKPGGKLTAGEEIISGNLQYRFTMQSDGNAVVYNRSSGKACWSTKTNGRPGSYAYMQPDGHFVVYGPGVPMGGTPYWFASGTYGHSSANMKMQNDGNLVIYEGSTALWATSWLTGQIGC